MIRVRHISGRDLGELEREINKFLELCDELHHVVRHITYITSQSNTSRSAFVEYESFEENECEDE